MTHPANERGFGVGDRVEYTAEPGTFGVVEDVATGKNGTFALVEFDYGETWWVDVEELQAVTDTEVGGQNG